MKILTVRVGFLIALALVGLGLYQDTVRPFVNHNGFYVGGVFVFLISAGYAQFKDKK